MKIIEIRDTVVPIKSEIRNAYIDFGLMTVSVVALITDVIRDGKPVVGFGFNSNGRYAQQGLLRERFIPRLNDAPPESLINDAGDNLEPEKIWNTLMKNEKPGGHGDRAVAAAALDMAVWDLVAKLAEQPLWRLLSERHNGGGHDAQVMVYPGGGYYYPGEGLERLQDEMRGYLDQGYRAVKMKIGAAPMAEDITRIEAVIRAVGSGGDLAVDANGRFDLDTALAYGKAMEPFDLFWFEEPGDPLDFALNAELAKHYPGALATGENLFSVQDARNLLRHGGMRPDRDILQFDCALSYGLVEYLRTLALLPDHGFGPRNVIPHGGHQMSLNIAAGLGLGGNESYPDVFHPFGGFADGIVVEDSRVGLPDAPGIGFEARAALIALMREVTET